MNDEEYVQVTYDGDWADEISGCGYFFGTVAAWERWKATLCKVVKISRTFSWCIGTNEDVEIEGGPNEVLRKCNVVPITKAELDTVRKLFLPHHHGELECGYFSFGVFDVFKAVVSAEDDPFDDE